MLDREGGEVDSQFSLIERLDLRPDLGRQPRLGRRSQWRSSAGRSSVVPASADRLKVKSKTGRTSQLT